MRTISAAASAQAINLRDGGRNSLVIGLVIVWTVDSAHRRPRHVAHKKSGGFAPVDVAQVRMGFSGDMGGLRVVCTLTSDSQSRQPRQRGAGLFDPARATSTMRARSGVFGQIGGLETHLCSAPRQVHRC